MEDVAKDLFIPVINVSLKVENGLSKTSRRFEIVLNHAKEGGMREPHGFHSKGLVGDHVVFSKAD